MKFGGKFKYLLGDKINMETTIMERIWKLLVRKSPVLELMRYMKERALDEDVKKVRDVAPDIKLSDIVIEGREEI